MEIPAKDVEGYLLYNPITNSRFFRVYYEEKDEKGHKKYTDYQLHIEDVKIKLLSGSLYQTPEGNYIDWPSAYLSLIKGNNT